MIDSKKSARILFVDDEADIIESYKSILGYTPKLVGSDLDIDNIHAQYFGADSSNRS